MNNRLWNKITLHNELHGFRQGRGTGNATIEANLAQKLAGIFHKPLFQVFIDVWKAYNSLYIGIYMKIIRVCDLGTNLQRLLQRYWTNKSWYQNPGLFLGVCYAHIEE